MGQIIYTIRTIMEKEDYRKFLYIATFRRNYLVIPMIAVMALAGAVLSAWSYGKVTLLFVFSFWVLLFCVSIGVICFKVERKNKRRISTDKTKTFGSVTILKFFDNYLVMETPATKGKNTLNYDQFYKLIESKDYFIFYFNANMASLLRKKDISNLEEFQTFIKTKFGKKFKKI